MRQLVQIPKNFSKNNLLELKSMPKLGHLIEPKMFGVTLYGRLKEEEWQNHITNNFKDLMSEANFLMFKNRAEVLVILGGNDLILIPDCEKWEENLRTISSLRERSSSISTILAKECVSYSQSIKDNENKSIRFIIPRSTHIRKFSRRRDGINRPKYFMDSLDEQLEKDKIKLKSRIIVQIVGTKDIRTIF